jgi:hypothetical protein
MVTWRSDKYAEEKEDKRISIPGTRSGNSLR